MDHGQVTITSRCLCGAHSFTASVPAESLPLGATCCHCSSCRHLTGALYFGSLDWPNPGEDISALQKYAVSKNVDIFFCATCSTPMFKQGSKPGEAPRVAAGTLQNAPNLVKYTDHIFIEDTGDGGASPWLRKSPDGTATPRWTRGNGGSQEASELVPHDWPPVADLPDPRAKVEPETVPFRCHCGGVDLVMRSAADMAGRPAAELPFMVDPETYKYLGTTDSCDSCRLSAGVDLPNWTFALLSHIDFPAGAQQAGGEFPRSCAALREAVTAAGSRNPLLGTLACYASSPDVGRYFCSRCSAVVFYAVDDRPDLVDVALGLLHHPSGARAEGLVKWDLGRVGWPEDVVGGWREHLHRAARDQAEDWRIQRGYPKSWRRVLAEQKMNAS